MKETIETLENIKAEIIALKDDAEVLYGHPLGFDRISAYGKCIDIVNKHIKKLKEEKMIYNDCRDCSFYKGNCGHHFVDGDDHICYKIPTESYMDGSFGPYGTCFEPSDRYKEEKKKEVIAELANDYSIEYLEEAINMKKAEKEEKE